MKTKILSWLLHHANRQEKSQHFYEIKNKLLKQYGTHIGYDVQYIPGKKCYTCGGTGVYKGYYYSGGVYYDDCNRCHGGWYKLPEWNILERLQFGKYTFHQPFKRTYKKPEIETPVIDGYIYHSHSKYGEFSRTILFLLYEKNYLSRWWKQPTWWRCQWWLPRNWFICIAHILKNGKNSYPFTEFKEWWNKPSGYVKGVTFDYEFFTGRKIPANEIEQTELPF